MGRGVSADWPERMRRAAQTKTNNWVSGGSCPDCGAPVMVPTVWFGVTPPPVKHSCTCRGFTPFTQLTTTDSTNSGD